MSVQKIDDLIKAAWNVVDSEFDIRAIYRWKKQAFEFLSDTLGPDHYYTLYFKNYIKEVEQQHLLTGGGILSAAKEEISQRSQRC